jgi:flagellar motor switch protein FliN/FliY
MSISRMTDEQIENMLGEILGNQGPKIRKVKFPNLEPTDQCENELDISLLSDVMTNMRVELGRSELTVREILDLEAGAVIELEKVAGEEVEVYINDQPFVSAEVVIINEAFGIRVNSFLETAEE